MCRSNLDTRASPSLSPSLALPLSCFEGERDVPPSQMTTDQRTLVSTISQVVMTTNEIWQSDLNELAGYVLAQEVGWLLAGCLTHTHYSFFLPWWYNGVTCISADTHRQYKLSA